MKYTPEIYAVALRDVVLEAKPSERDAIIRRFVSVVARNGDARKLAAVVKELERKVVHANGGRLITIEYAREMPKRLTDALKTFFKPNDRVSTYIDPELIAGTRITIDNEYEFDFSLLRRLNKMFK